ncbi:MAG: hypothetical protein K8L97_31400 [Anaerolineae bacterium]|nr:hypothetical protein [Anaerolineae bacterium]
MTIKNPTIDSTISKTSDSTLDINRVVRARRGALWIGLVTLIGIGLLCGVALAGSDFNPLAFAKIGTRFAELDPEGTRGYDGQFAYYIARDGYEAVPHIDGATLRYQRILYPVVSRALAFGNPELVPWTLIAVNILAHSAGAALLAYLLALHGGAAWGALVYSVWIGALFGVRLDLNEPLCVALGLGAIATYAHGRYRITILLLILSTLAKELGLIFAAGLALHAFFNGQRRWGILIFGGPLLAFLAWWGFMRLWLGRLPIGYPAAHIHLIPLQGMFAELEETALEFVFLAIWLGLPALVIFLLAARRMWRQRRVELGAALALAGAGFVLVMPDVSWQDPVAAYRVGISLVVGGLLFVGQCYPRRIGWLAALWLPTLLVVLMTPSLWL